MNFTLLWYSLWCIWSTRKCSYTQSRPAASHTKRLCVTKCSHNSDQNETEWSNNGGCSLAFTKTQQNNSGSSTQSSNQPASHHITGIIQPCNESPILFFSFFFARALWTRHTTYSRALWTSPYSFDSIISENNGANKKKKKTKIEKNTGLSLKAIKIIITMSCIQRTHENYNCNMRWNCVCAQMKTEDY